MRTSVSYIDGQANRGLLRCTSICRAIRFCLFLWCSGLALPTSAFDNDFKALYESTCIACHSNTLLTQLDLSALSRDLSDPAVFRKWERVYERLERGEMPPPPMLTPPANIVEPAMASLKSALLEANLAVRGEQRAPLKRLTKLEYQYTLQDLFHLDPATAERLVVALPEEADSGGIDTVAQRQGVSALHVRSYMQATQVALDKVFDTKATPPTVFHVNYRDSGYLQFFAEAEILGAGIVNLEDDAVVSYFDYASTYMFHSGTEGFAVPEPGRYRVTVDAYPYKSHSPLVLTIYKGELQAAAASITKLLAEFDLIGPDGLQVSVETYLRPNDMVTPSVAEVDLAPDAYKYNDPKLNMREYEGEGIALRSMTIEGPLSDPNTPSSLQRLLGDIALVDGEPNLTKEPIEHIQDVVASFARRAFRRAVTHAEVQTYVELAKPGLAAGRDFLSALRVPLTAILNSPKFLFFTENDGYLSDFGLANRLAYFIWRSMPDDELLSLAENGQLSEIDVLETQVERLLDDEKALRFVHDFVGQALRLNEMQATTPDAGLYPEFDDRLAKAMVAETELFFQELVVSNLSISNFVDADFTFLNRRLAEHYGIPNVDDQHMRKVDLPEDNIRGGFLSQAAIHKVTANGTTTSPVSRGNFVLANVLGQPSPPPPPNVAGLEPDIRGTTTIRDQLAAHRTNPVCASCHLNIDPPGFAMEQFNAIGGFREKYRVFGPPIEADGRTFPGQYSLGLDVQSDGITQDGDRFQGFQQYQKILVDRKLKYIAQHFASQLFVMATGADVEFADRDAVAAVVAKSADAQYPVRSLIHDVAQSELFRSR